MSFKARVAPANWITAIFVWCIAGVGFVAYLVYAEWVLHTICPFCTIIHVLNVIAMYFSTRLYRLQVHKPLPFTVVCELKGWVAVWAVVFLLPLVAFNIQREEFPRELLDRCLYEKHAAMFGAPTCGFCQQQKRLLGDTMDMVKFIDCSADGKEQCEASSVVTYPTWVLRRDGAEVKRHSGVLTVSKLFEFYECPTPADKTAAPVAAASL